MKCRTYETRSNRSDPRLIHRHNNRLLPGCTTYMGTSSRCCPKAGDMHSTSHVAVYTLTSGCILVATAWIHRRRLMHSRTSCTLTIMKTEWTSCMEATILGREWCYTWSLICSECLNGSVAGTIQIGIVGCHSWNPILLLM
jgi:hypothetical protein